MLKGERYKEFIQDSQFFKDQREKEKKDTEQILAKLASSEMEQFFEKYKNQFRLVFKRYVEFYEKPQDQFSGVKILKYQGYITFLSDFNFFSIIMDKSSAQLIFRTLTREKTKDTIQPMGLTYNEYKEALLRIAIKKRDVFDKIYQQKKSETSNENQADQNLDVNNQSKNLEVQRQKGDEEEDYNLKDNDVDNRKNDEYDKISDISITSLEGLLYFMDLPETKQGILSNIDKIREMNVNAIRERKKCIHFINNKLLIL